MTKKILIAEDDVALLRAISTRLTSKGYEVIATQDGYQALDFARRHKPDLLVLDVNLPAGDGFSVQERMSKIDELSHTRVVYITGEASGSVDATAARLGAFSVIHKPFTAKDLLTTIEAALRDTRGNEFDRQAA